MRTFFVFIICDRLPRVLIFSDSFLHLDTGNTHRHPSRDRLATLLMIVITQSAYVNRFLFRCSSFCGGLYCEHSARKMRYRKGIRIFAAPWRIRRTH